MIPGIFRLTFYIYLGILTYRYFKYQLTKFQEPQVLTRSKTATRWELDCILPRAAKLTDRDFTIFPPSDSEGNLSVDKTIEYYKKEIIKTINQIKTEEV